MSLRALPEELLTNVLALLPNVVFEGRCRVVCRRWRDLQTSSAFREPKVASVPLEFFADEAPASDDDASEYDPPCREPDSDDMVDSSEEGDSTDSDGDDEDDEDGAAL